MLDKISHGIEKDLQRLGIDADVDFMLESFWMIIFDTLEDMHLYKMLGVFKEGYAYRYQVKE